MPNKDSFTFSDKLRKSKSVPLSKRLPSIVGGKNTQKRTLVQRAQRDLPFILVAALALLLLPFLSRTGSDDIASTGDFAWNTLTDERSFAEGGSSDIMPAGSMQDPLDLILRPRSDIEGSGVTMGTDASKSAYGSGTGSEDGYGTDSYSSRYSKKTGSSSTNPDYNTRKSFDESYTTKTTKKPATTKYGQKTRAGIRKSFERKGTDINRALRLSQMQGVRGGSPISHTLPIGQGPNKGSGAGFREGVRPIALQPLVARDGIGRSMTGENLYAEAARSRNAMNAGGPAKANLLAAQMRDVDGKLTPEGPGFGGPGPGASVRPGAGGGPGNNNGYHVGKPWWWDMMQARSQKMWDLLYYEPRRIWYTNMYNYLSQLMNCLFTGNKDGDVSTMFGKGAADSDFMCVKNGQEIMVRYNKQKPTSTSKDKDGKTTEESIDSNWFLVCDQLGGQSIEKKKDAKSFLQVRAECVGLDVVWDWLKDITKHTKYDSHCLGVNSDPMSFSLDIERSNARGKHNTRRENKLKDKTVIALLAKVKDGQYKDKEIVVYAQQGNTLSKEGSDFAKDFNDNNSNCTLSRLIALVSKKTTGQIEHVLDIYNDNRRLWQGEVTAGRSICENGDSKFKPATLDDIRRWTDLGIGKKIERDTTPRYAECEIWEKKPKKGILSISDSPCGPYPETQVGIKETDEFSATIDNSADKHVYAVLVDQIDQETNAKVVYVADFDSDSYRDLKTCPNKGSTCTYRFTVNAASLGWAHNEYRKQIVPMSKEVVNSTDAIVKPGGTARGSGKVFWIITKGSSHLKVKEGDDLGHGLGLVNLEDFLDYNQAAFHVTCSYRWCDDIGVCGIPDGTKISDNMCREGDLAYPAIPIPIEKEKDGKKETVTIYVKIEGEEGIDYILDGLPYCEHMCKGGNGDLYKQGPDGTPEDEPECPYANLSEDARRALGIIKPCPVCCKYECGNTSGNYLSVEAEDGKYYIIDADPRKCAGKKAEVSCEVAAWSDTPDTKFTVYTMSNPEYDCTKLPLVPNQEFTIASSSTIYTTNLDNNTLLTLNEDQHVFDTIKSQANYTGKPREFKLFPLLTLPKPEDIPEIDLGLCSFCEKPDYQNAYVTPRAADINAISSRIEKCLSEIKKLKDSLPADKQNIVDEIIGKLYFYGYASMRGSHDPNMITGAEDRGCITSPLGDGSATGRKRGAWETGYEQLGDCNKALSEDRILYIMDQVIGKLSGKFPGTETENISKYNGKNGFTNVSAARGVSLIGKPTYRLNKESLNNLLLRGGEFTFVSRPCGSDGSYFAYDVDVNTGLKDRYVLITLIGDDDQEKYCENRMECDSRATEQMQQLVDKLNKALGTNNIKFNP